MTVPDKSFDNRRIAKNTFMLYCRTLIIMLVTLYTSRVVLKVLGVEDYGIYNVVGGIVVMFSFITSTLGSASQRYIAYDLAQNNKERLRQTFSLIMLSYGIVAFITLVLAEIIGVWFLNSHMNIPENRIVAANWVLQASVVGFILNIITAPYMAVIIAHERMNVYAYISILDAILKLTSIYILQFFIFDNLIIYAVLMLLCTSVVTAIYRYYCKKHYSESHYSFYYDTVRLKDIISYAWWNMFGTISHILRNQGVNILLNLFFNPAINAARAISFQVYSAVTSFVNNYFTALRPQITKSYASGDLERMRGLIYTSSKLSFFLLLLLSLPVFLNVDDVLCLWLSNPPQYTNTFVNLIIVNALVEVINNPLVAGLQATGRIKCYQMVASIIGMLNLPISYLCLLLGFLPEVTFYVSICLAVICWFPRFALCKKYYSLDISKFVIYVVIRCWIIALLGCYIGCNIVSYLNDMHTFVGLLLSSAGVVAVVILLIFVFGITPNERKVISSLLIKKM